MNFVAVDVETANARMSSICQIGLVCFENGQETKSTSILVDPHEGFDGINSAIHGITADDVIGCPTFEEVYANLKQNFGSSLLVCHGHFDRVSFGQACIKSGFGHFENIWLDTARVARRAWPEHFGEGYGLSALADRLNLPLVHHDAVSDARCAAHVLLMAVAKANLSIEEWLARVELPIDGLNYNKRVTRAAPSLPEPNDGRLYGETVVFTGSLSLPRAEAADLASGGGAAVENLVTKRTTILVVGDQDPFRLNGKGKSEKHLKAERLIEKGQRLRIMTETDFAATLS